MATGTNLTLSIQIKNNWFPMELFKSYFFDKKQHIELFYWRPPFNIELYNIYECGEFELKQATMLEF